MIIFGSRGMTSSAGQGQFNCPQCRATVPYGHMRVRRFFTLYFIPVIPLGVHSEYVECQRCLGTFDLAVLNSASNAGEAELQARFHWAVKRVMVLMMLVDGDVADEEVEAVRELYRQLTNIELSAEDVRLEVSEVEREPQSVATCLAGCAGMLNDEGKEIVVRAAFLVAAADGNYDDREKALIAEIGQALGMSEAHLNGVVASMLDG